MVIFWKLPIVFQINILAKNLGGLDLRYFSETRIDYQGFYFVHFKLYLIRMGGAIRNILLTLLALTFSFPPFFPFPTTAYHLTSR
jgi:hypothetical protein